jgi:hypothetical protein
VDRRTLLDIWCVVDIDDVADMALFLSAVYMTTTTMLFTVIVMTIIYTMCVAICAIGIWNLRTDIKCNCAVCSAFGDDDDDDDDAVLSSLKDNGATT